MTLFFVAVISPFAFWDKESMNDSVLPDAVGSALSVCFVLKSDAFFPESLRFPVESNDAKLSSVADVTLSAFLASSV